MAPDDIIAQAEQVAAAAAREAFVQTVAELTQAVEQARAMIARGTATADELAAMDAQLRARYGQALAIRALTQR
jgi:hypothetical protein